MISFCNICMSRLRFDARYISINMTDYNLVNSINLNSVYPRSYIVHIGTDSIESILLKAGVTTCGCMTPVACERSTNVVRIIIANICINFRNLINKDVSYYYLHHKFFLNLCR